jgi:hypothetical protein
VVKSTHEMEDQVPVAFALERLYESLPVVPPHVLVLHEQNPVPRISATSETSFVMLPGTQGCPLVEVVKEAYRGHDHEHQHHRDTEQQSMRLVDSGAAPCAIVSRPGSRYGDCAKPQANTIDPTAATVSMRYQR